MNTNQSFELLNFVRREKEIMFLIAIVALGAVLPHPQNISPIAALGLFAGSYIDRKAFLLVPLAAALLADLTTTGFYNFTVMVFVYAGYLASSLSGRYIVRGRSVLYRAPLAVLLASLAFFLISNFGNWLAFYPLSLSSLMECYVSGLPFFGRTLFGNVLYSLLFFGGYEFFIHQFSSQLQQASPVESGSV